MTDVAWAAGSWTHPPAAVDTSQGLLVATAIDGSDAWRKTAYGFIHDSEHALLAPLAQGSAMEVELSADFSQQFDQAGLFVRASPDNWIKAGVEFVDGSLKVGAVVTRDSSDWSTGDATQLSGAPIRVRVSWANDAVTVRVGAADGPLHLVRVAPFAAPGTVAAGPFLCAPSRAGFTTTFRAWRVGSADASLHE